MPALDFDAASTPTTGDEELLYSFDKEASPSSSLGLDGLVNKAEEHFRSRETEKIVRREYEILNAEGEAVTGRRRGRGGSGKGSPEIGVVKVVDVDGDWEAI